MDVQHVLNNLSPSFLGSDIPEVPSSVVLLDNLFRTFKMRMHPLFSISTLLTTSLAVNLFAARYDGVISTLSLTKSHGNYTLVETSRNTNSSKNPSWLQKHPNSKFIFATEENFSGPNGSIASYSKSAAGVLTLLDKEATSTGYV
jgi:hypothetical protein